MNEFNYNVQLRWADMDPNLHLRHSVYYDLGAICRVAFFNQYQLTAEVMHQLQIGFILLREESVFRREIRLGDEVFVTIHLLKAKSDFSRVSVQHQIFKRPDTLSATLTIDGAWIHIAKRKLISPPDQVVQIFEQMPRTNTFEWIGK